MSAQQGSSTLENGDFERTFDVVVIGAGWAGIAAANTLNELGITNIIVLEARNYIGGRSVTSYELGRDSPVDLGSTFVHGRINNPVQEMVEANRVPHASVANENAVFDSHGRRCTESEVGKLWQIYKRFDSYVKEKQDRAVEDDEEDEDDTCLQSALAKFIEQEQIHDDFEGQVGLKWTTDTVIAQEYAASLSELSLRWFDYDTELKGGDTYLAVPQGGHSAVIENYASPIASHVQLQSIVTSVDYTEELTKIIYVNGKAGASECIWARHVLVTLPVGVLKEGSVEFVPPLPESKQRAIEKIGFGLLNKCVLYWNDMEDRDVFWPKDRDWIMRVATRDATTPQGRWSELSSCSPLSRALTIRKN